MVSPDDFAYNPQTAVSNVFQHKDAPASEAARLAMAEFDAVVEKMEKEKIRVLRVRSREDVKTPDAVFPNNWFSTHRGKTGTAIVVYPMATPNRRDEIRVDLLESTLRHSGIDLSEVIDLSGYARQGKALEGTGAMVFDRIHKVAFVSLSPRADRAVLEAFCARLGYRPVIFHSYDRNALIYHTNVMMSVGADFAVICSESIKDPNEKQMVLDELKGLGKRIVEISPAQMGRMCGNVLELRTTDGKPVIIMSETAHAAFTPDQKAILAGSGALLPFRIPTIEHIGGGSIRCMVAEIFH